MNLLDERELRRTLDTFQSGHEAAWILEASLEEPETDRAAWVERVVERRRTGEPLAYILGRWAFRAWEFAVGPGVLIPRPETEELVDLVMNEVRALWTERIDRAPDPTVAPAPLRIVDFGAGSGCIGLSLARELKPLTVHVTFVEASSFAWPWLERNVGAQGCIVRGRWEEFTQSYDVLVSNPPYLSAEEREQLDPGVKDFEPATALVPVTTEPDPHGRSAYVSLFAHARQHLAPGGVLAFELGVGQPEWIGGYAESLGFLEKSRLVKDMAGKDRFFVAKRRYG